MKWLKYCLFNILDLFIGLIGIPLYAASYLFFIGIYIALTAALASVPTYLAHVALDLERGMLGAVFILSLAAAAGIIGKLREAIKYPEEKVSKKVYGMLVTLHNRMNEK